MEKEESQNDYLLRLTNCFINFAIEPFLPPWQQHLLARGIIHRPRPRHLCLSEVMTILIAFHTSPSFSGVSLPCRI